MSSPPGRRVALSAMVVLALVLAPVLAGCGSDEQASVVSLESAERPDPSGEPGPDELLPDDADAPYDEAFCESLAGVAATPPADDDPTAAVETLLGLADEAPEELRDDFEVLAGAIEDFSEVDQDSPEAFGAAFEIFLRPDVIQASVAIDLYASDVCGVDLDSNPTEGALPDAESPSDLPGAPDGVDISLEDLDAVEADAESAGATWPSKVVGTSILNDTDITLSADASDPFTVDEAVQACEDVQAALLGRNPALVVSVANGDTTVAAAPAGGTCAPA